jgi:cold shock CspA family protein
MQIKASDLLHQKMGEKISSFINSEIQAGGEYATLNDGQKVEFEVGQGQKGPCANKVQAL